MHTALMRIRKHRHRWVKELTPWTADGQQVEFVYCKTKGCEFCYEQMLLFDVRTYEQKGAA